VSWLEAQGLGNLHAVHDLGDFESAEAYDSIINFIGVGDPAAAQRMGASVLDITHQYDHQVLRHLRAHPACRYVFLSSGAAFGDGFASPVDVHSRSQWDINNLAAQDWYGIAKFYAEACHRALPDFSIFDVRVFNYFSHTQDMDARFFITDMVRAIRDSTLLNTSAENIWRDYIGPEEIAALIDTLLKSPPANAAVDCYSLQPVDKFALLDFAKNNYGLKYEVSKPAQPAGINATGAKSNYFSVNKRAADFGYAPARSSLDVIRSELARLADQVGGNA
jgi:nucleoside-diphosphate-sugar epimerase